MYKRLLAACLLLMAMHMSASGQEINMARQSYEPITLTKPAINKNQDKSVSEDWLSRAQSYIEKSEYFFKQQQNGSDIFFASNRIQRTGFRINNAGFTASPVRYADKMKQEDIWSAGLQIQYIGKGSENIFDLSQSEYYSNINEENLSVQYNNFAIEYVNNKTGLRQNFIVNKKPGGEKNLEIIMVVTGNLSPFTMDNVLQFKNNKGITKLFYRDLKVWDANHHPLQATMKLKDNKIAIIVNDANAIYPVTVDPLNQTPEWTTSANGILPTLIGQLAVDAAYGFSVAGLGDVNGDGYSDVGVGAPAVVDIISGSGSLASVGAVFVYYGSASGLPTIPNAKLQPTTLVAGALFGYSLAGGDINNDGRNDIIVGAPLDRVTISIGGNSTASGTVGKAYVFNGATLNTNTSPLLTLQLSGNGILRNGINLSVRALFGYSVAVTEDLNGDGKKDMIVGAPAYAGIKTGLLGDVLDVQSGGAFVFLTANNNNLSLVKLEPIKQSLLGLGLLSENINGLLFGYAVDGTGDYNGDGRPDVVATAPAGIDAGSLSGLLNGKLLQGSAIVYYGTGSGVNVNPGAVLTATSGGLLTNLIGSIANVANLFGESVRGIRNAAGARNGNILVGAPLGGAIINVLGLDLKTGTVSVFKKKASSPSGYVAPDQVLSSPRNSNNILQIIQSNLLFGFSLDNALDVNCDGYGDIIVGEPISSGVQLLNANVAGGAAYVYLGNASGTYQTAPIWTLTAYEDAFLGINGTSLIGYSVAGAGKIKGSAFNDCILVGSPSRTLDFGSGLLNLGNTFGTLFSLVAGNNGIGKAYLFDLKICDHTPIAVNDVNTTNEDTPVSGNAATNDIPSADGGNVWSLVGANGGALHGTVTMNPDGTYTYTPTANYNGSDVFTYQLCDADGDCSTATVTITVNPVDDVPIAVNDVNTTNEDTPVSGNAATNDTPSGDGGNVWSLVGTNGGATHGTVTMNPDGTYTYTPAANYNGSDVFTYKLCDADGDCSTATVTITINPVNDVPVAVNDVNTTNEDTPVNGNAASNDTPSGDCQNTWSLVGANGGAAHGTVTMNPNGTYTYTPAPNYNGTDVFTYKLCDCDGDCSTATVTVTVNPVNDIPVAVNDVATTNEDNPVNGNAASNDTPSGDCTNLWSLVGTNGGATHGTVTMNPDGTYTYTPAANYNGSDVFTYKLCDCDGDCSTATVTITINPVDDVPVAVNDVSTTNEDTPVNGNAASNDTPSGDGGNVWSLVGTNGGAAHGTVTMNTNGTYTYTPAANYNGSDVFTYKLCDVDGDCSTATVTITINPVDDAPVAVNDVNTTNEDTPVSGNAATNDTPSGDGGNVWSLVGTNGGAVHGTVTMNPDGTYTYTPAANYNGSDVFTYKLCDTDGDCSTATVTITINPVDDVPIAVNDVNTTNEDTPVSGNAATNDTPSGDGGNVWSLVGTNGGAAHGTVTMNPDGTYTYTPAANYNGSDVFTYKLCDADGDCSTATVTITINPVDDVPIAVNDVNTTNEDTPVSGNAATNDTPSGDGGNVWSLVGTNGGATHGTITMNTNGTYTYTPAANYNGSDVFTYKLCDADGDCSTATVTITINPVNDVPVAVNDVNTTNQNTAVSGNAATNDTPSGDGGNVWSLVGTNGGAAHGTVTMNSNGTYTYTPAVNYSGSDVFTYKLCDVDGDCSTATVTITINSTCATDTIPPTIICPSNRTLALGANCSANLPDYRGLATVSDNCTPTANITITQSPAAGTVVSGTGATTITLTATDANGNSASCTFTVTRVDQTPPAITCPSNKTLVLDASCSASLPDYRSLATVSDNCTPAANISITQSPAPGTVVNGIGTTTVTLTATDASGNSASCSFTVTRVDQTAPTITCPSNKTLVLGANCSASLPDYRSLATVSDNCTSAANITITQSPAPGTIVNGTGTTTVTLTATDASGNSSSCSFTVTRVDQTAPVLSCQPNKTIGCNVSLTFDAPTASDNCGPVTVNVISTTSTDNGNAVVYTRTWQAVDGSGNPSATCSQSVTQNKCSAHLFPTSTTCNTYQSGAQPLDQLCYATSGQKVSNVTPGVFFYFSLITAPSSSFCIDVVQTNSCGFKLFSIQQGKQIYLYNINCGTVANGTEVSTGQGRICISNAVPGAQYVVSVKYDSKSVNGSTFTGSAPVCQYNFECRINGTTVGNSQGSISLVPNCNAAAVTTTQNQVAPSAKVIFDNSGTIRATVFPNPSEDHFKLLVATTSNEIINVRVIDISGRIVNQMKTTAQQLLQFGNELKQGSYFVEVRQGAKRVILKIEKL
jgi:VCBS repeat-containing protein